MHKIFRYIAIVLLLILVLASVLFIDLSADVQAQSSKQIDQAESVNTLLADVRYVFRKRYQAHQLHVNETQANSLAGFVQRAKDQASADLNFNDEYIVVSMSYQLINWFDLFANVHVVVKEGKGLEIDSVRIGSVTLPGNWALGIAESIVNSYTNTELATTAISSIDSIQINNKDLTLSLNPLDALLREIKNIETGSVDDNDKILKIRVAHYLRLLDGMYLPPVNADQVSVSLNELLVPLMQEAQTMSQAEGGSATLENEAVLLAVAIYAGHRRFATIVGNMDFALAKIPQLTKKPALANRQDLSLHFIFSAAIKLLSEQGVSVAVGEFKELMDRGEGGSGYSFVDLAADMAGAQFAALAVNPKTAERVQQVLIVADNESAYFPSIEGLEEGMSKAEFTKKYKEVDSSEYQSVVAQIEKRLKDLAVYP
ncbi:hypothetical protein [Agaribacter flavus]|uniref:Uncharacterized protein n=1 Tax=Agaribacter flavus TaxID=1902781 RepID=A0ABV7FRP8_9ALTE